jgi:hypothetical protein
MNLKYVKYAFGKIFLVMLISSCAGGPQKSGSDVGDVVVAFSVAVQARNFDRAIEFLTAEERNKVLDGRGNVKEEYVLGMRRLNLSTLNSKPISLSRHGKLVGMLEVIEESVRLNSISSAQRELTISREVEKKPEAEAEKSEEDLNSDFIVDSNSVVEELDFNELPEEIKDALEDFSFMGDFSTYEIEILEELDQTKSKRIIKFRDTPENFLARNAYFNAEGVLSEEIDTQYSSTVEPSDEPELEQKQSAISLVAGIQSGADSRIMAAPIPSEVDSVTESQSDEDDNESDEECDEIVDGDCIIYVYE